MLHILYIYILYTFLYTDFLWVYIQICTPVATPLLVTWTIAHKDNNIGHRTSVYVWRK